MLLGPQLWNTDLTNILHSTKGEYARKGRPDPAPTWESSLARRAGTLTHKLEGGIEMPLEVNENLIGPDESAYLPVLDIAHKVTTVAKTRDGIGS
jgi:hypothetical protein